VFLGMEDRGTVGQYVYDKVSHETRVGPNYIPGVVSELQDGKLRLVLPEFIRERNFTIPSWVK